MSSNFRLAYSLQERPCKGKLAVHEQSQVHYSRYKKENHIEEAEK